MKKINTRYLATLKPCKDRFDNWKDKYSKFSGTLAQFLRLKHITFEDKKWVFFRTLPKDKLPLIAADFAEMVLPIYAKYNPDTSVLEEAIAAARSGNKERAYAATNAADAATYATYAAPAAATAAAYAACAATAAAYAAYSAAYSATYAAYSAANVASASAYAASAASAAAGNKLEAAQLQLIIKYAKNLK